MRDPKVRLRGLSEIATNPPHAFLLQCTYLQLAFSGHPTHTDGCLLWEVKRTSHPSCSPKTRRAGLR